MKTMGSWWPLYIPELHWFLFTYFIVKHHRTPWNDVKHVVLVLCWTRYEKILARISSTFLNFSTIFQKNNYGDIHFLAVSTSFTCFFFLLFCVFIFYLLEISNKSTLRHFTLYVQLLYERRASKYGRVPFQTNENRLVSSVGFLFVCT